jgi:hypothetical protein
VSQPPKFRRYPFHGAKEENSRVLMSHLSGSRKEPAIVSRFLLLNVSMSTAGERAEIARFTPKTAQSNPSNFLSSSGSAHFTLWPHGKCQQS